MNGTLKPIITIDGKNVPKEFSWWTPDENKRAHYDARAKNIISSTLTLDEFYRDLVCELYKRHGMSWGWHMEEHMKLSESNTH